MWPRNKLVVQMCNFYIMLWICDEGDKLSFGKALYDIEFYATTLLHLKQQKCNADDNLTLRYKVYEARIFILKSGKTNCYENLDWEDAPPDRGWLLWGGPRLGTVLWLVFLLNGEAGELRKFWVLADWGAGWGVAWDKVWRDRDDLNEDEADLVPLPGVLMSTVLNKFFK